MFTKISPLGAPPPLYTNIQDEWFGPTCRWKNDITEHNIGGEGESPKSIFDVFTNYSNKKIDLGYLFSGSNNLYLLIYKRKYYFFASTPECQKVMT